jgi:succinate dehydrogenase/fumarate reductase flavoprotein subunit
LAGNAFTECIVFGARSGEAAAEYASAAELPAVPGDSEVLATSLPKGFSAIGPSVADLKRRIRKTMWERGGIARNGEGLRSALDEVMQVQEQLLRGETQRPDRLVGYYDLGSMVQVAEAVLQSALIRKESRGAHFREDFPEQDDAQYLGTVFVQMEGGVLKSWFEPLA